MPIKPREVTFTSNHIQIAANLYTPHSTTAELTNRLPAIVVSHPFGGVKEQTAGLYATLLSQNGFITLAFDAAYQGSSGGEPRYLEDPSQRVEDIKSAVTYLTTLREVDPERIGALGICASGGYVPNAAQTDKRIKAVATISAADVGDLMRHGLGGTQSVEQLNAALEQSSKERTLEAQGQKPRLEHIVPNTPDDVTKDTPTLYAEGTDYYRTSRAAHPNSANWYVFRSLDLMVQFQAYALNELIAPRPLLCIAGDKADTLYYSERCIAAAKEPKELYKIKGATHIDLYDHYDHVLPKLSDFFEKNLK
jgi:uncharacterized protein